MLFRSLTARLVRDNTLGKVRPHTLRTPVVSYSGARAHPGTRVDHEPWAARAFSGAIGSCTAAAAASINTTGGTEQAGEAGEAEAAGLPEELVKAAHMGWCKPVREFLVAKDAQEETTPVQEKGIDVDTEMPYGELEPFGREDTAQELTEQSVKESDEMVDQLERAEVAEEKRAVFRALTRLRGAAITSFDGIARSQTGNIDEYNKIHKWRRTHPLHHLADEESDISKWAFPDNADF